MGGCPRCLSIPSHSKASHVPILLPQSTYLNPKPTRESPHHTRVLMLSAQAAQGDFTAKVLLSAAFSSSWLLQEQLFLSPKPIEQIASDNRERSEDCLQTDPNAYDVFAV